MYFCNEDSVQIEQTLRIHWVMLRHTMGQSSFTYCGAQFLTEVPMTELECCQSCSLLCCVAS